MAGRVDKGAVAPCPPNSNAALKMVGTRSLSSGAHSRDPLALPVLRCWTEPDEASTGKEGGPAQQAVVHDEGRSYSAVQKASVKGFTSALLLGCIFFIHNRALVVTDIAPRRWAAPRDCRRTS
jgi:hypothetical protein